MLFVPPFPERYAATVSIKRDEEDSIEAGLQPGRNDNKGRPPSGDAYLRGDGKNLVAELNVLFCLGHVRPIRKDCRAAAHGFHKRRNLIGAILGK